MGFYMGVFNFFIVIPQIVAAALLGFCIKMMFNNESIYALVIGGIYMIIAGLLCVFVQKEQVE
jgi:maltose/moltooligosaccharide transporter